MDPFVHSCVIKVWSKSKFLPRISSLLVIYGCKHRQTVWSVRAE